MTLIEMNDITPTSSLVDSDVHTISDIHTIYTYGHTLIIRETFKYILEEI